MEIKFILLVLMSFNVFEFNAAYCHRTQRICDKYCEIERVRCAAHQKHPLCTEFNVTDSKSLFRSQIVNITNSDVRNTVLFEINRFRNDLAFGYVANQEEATNLQVVHWSFDLQLILEAQLQYNNVCDHISLNDTEFVEIARFQVHKKGVFYQLTNLINTIKSSYTKVAWNPLIRAEFNRIGCVVTDENSDYTLVCLTNKKLPDSETFDAKTAYEIGPQCKSCRCNQFWSGLCDSGTFNDSHDHDNFHFDSDDDNEIVLYILIILLVLLVIVIVGFVCLCLMCVECISKPDEEGTYTLRNKFHSKRGTVFEK